MSDALKRPRGQLLSRPADDLTKPIVDPQHRPVRGDVSDPDGSILERRAEPSLALAKCLVMSEALYKVGSLARIKIETPQILLVRTVHRPKLRREHTKRRTIPANERRRQNRPISGSTRHGAKWRVMRINLDIFDDDSLSRAERPATCRMTMR